MILKRFTTLIIIRIVLLMGNVLLISSIFGDKRLFFSQLILLITLIIQTAELIRFVNHTNRELAKLFYAIKHSDFSISFKNPMRGQSFQELQESMAEIIHSYKMVKIEKEAQFHFLQLLVNQLHIGIIAIENNEKITLVNPTAEKMIGVEGIKNWKLIQQLNPRLTNDIEQLGDNGKKLIELSITGEPTFVSLAVNTVLVLDKSLKLVTLQNIDSEIDQKEIEAWHKLIRILTHEIMNSVTPISSLTETLQGFLEHKNGREKRLEELQQDTISDIRFSLETIQKRTDGLLQFVENYRKLTKVPKPVLVQTEVKPFLVSVLKLMDHEISKNAVRVDVECPDQIFLTFDPPLIEQVFINIIANALHALQGRTNPLVKIIFSSTDRQATIEVSDNGKGIAQKELSEIFIPFFTTKKDGSGIGLSLSKEIMTVHGGAIRVKSNLNLGTSFFLHFKR